MNVVFQNAYFQVLEYPELNAIELVDVTRAAGMLMQGGMADSFRANIERVLADEPTEEALETVIGGYKALMNQPLYTH